MHKRYRCLICGYVHVGEQPPPVCPVCGVSADHFEIYEEGVQNKKVVPGSWRCINCEYIHGGNRAPEICPVCGVKQDMFEPYEKNELQTAVPEDLDIVIIGGGIAGLSCAEEARKHSDKAKVTIVSSEDHLPYYRLNLTRYIAGEIGEGSLNVYREEWYAKNGIKVLLRKEALEIDKKEKTVKLNDGTGLNYGKLVIANGAHPFIPPIPGSTLENVISVRTLEDAEFICNEISKYETCICIGGGILGLETAGAIAKSGVKVTLLEGAEWLMPRQLNKNASGYLKNYLANIGIEVKEDVKIKEIYGDTCCEGVRLSSGEVYSSGLVIITAGVRPNTYIARKAGLEVDKGLIVNNQMQTSDENIYAAGDVTEHYGMLYGLWNIAQSQGKIAAQNILGMKTEFGGVPRSNVLKVLGLDMLSIGEFIPLDGSYYQYEKQTSDSYISFVIRDGKITGAIIIGDKILSNKVKKAVETGMNFPHVLYNDVESIIAKLIE